jgi:hypothetical protein
MKKYSILRVTGLTILLISGLFLNSCEEAADILDELKIFNFKYTYLPASTTSGMAMAMGNQVPDSIEAQSFVFNWEDVPLGVDPAVNNTAKLFGDPSTSQSQLIIRMHRKDSTDNNYPRFIIIDITGPIREGQVYTTNGYLEVYTGLAFGSVYPTYTTKQINNTAFSIKITELNTTLKRIGGDFHGFARFKDNPEDSDPLLIHSGTFSLKYKTN